MKNYWYYSRSNEIFLDLDSYGATRRALSVLAVAARTKKLDFSRVWVYPTNLAKNHYHIIVELNVGMSLPVRTAWSLWMGNDRLRAAYVLMRWPWIMAGDLLVSKQKYYRAPDATCICRAKHKDPKVTGHCRAMRQLLGEDRSADYFARTGPMPRGRKMRVPWGYPIEPKELKRWEIKKDA